MKNEKHDRAKNPLTLSKTTIRSFKTSTGLRAGMMETAITYCVVLSKSCARH